MAEVWRTRGVVPSMVMGHSVGELVAACVAGVMTMETGMELTMKRSRFMQVVGLPMLQHTLIPVTRSQRFQSHKRPCPIGRGGHDRRALQS